MAGVYSFGCLLFLAGMGLVFGIPPRKPRAERVHERAGFEFAGAAAAQHQFYLGTETARPPA